jgi:DNA-binding GntR family transcriptional regulator
MYEMAEAESDPQRVRVAPERRRQQPDGIPTRVDWLIHELSEEIRSGRIGAGERLRQVEIAKRYGVSTTPVREAFSALERQGLLSILPHRGAVVFKPTVPDVREMYEIRIALEPLAARRAAGQLTERNLAELEALLARMREVSPDDTARFHKLNEAFHRKIYDAAGQPRLSALISDLRDSSASYMRLFAISRPNGDEIQREHAAIFEACRRRDPDAAAEATVNHLQHVVDRLADVLDESPESGSPAAAPTR